MKQLPLVTSALLALFVVVIYGLVLLEPPGAWAWLSSLRLFLVLDAWWMIQGALLLCALVPLVLWHRFNGKLRLSTVLVSAMGFLLSVLVYRPLQPW